VVSEHKHSSSAGGTPPRVTTHTTADGTVLRVIMHGRTQTPRPVILFVAGWASTPFTWRYFMPHLSSWAEVHYFETREKASSNLSRSTDVSITAMASDIASYIEQNITGEPYGLIGASTGANLAISALRLAARPAWAVLVLPHVRVPIATYLNLFRFIPAPALRCLKPVILWLFRLNRLVGRTSQKQEGAFAALQQADLAKLRRSLFSWMTYRLESSELANLSNLPCLIIAASQDSTHNAGDAQSISTDLPRSHYYDGRTFTWAHSTHASRYVMNWVEHLE